MKINVMAQYTPNAAITRQNRINYLTMLAQQDIGLMKVRTYK